MRSAKYHNVYLPCKTYIRKYITSIYGDPVPAYNRSSLGCYINRCLEKKSYTNRMLTASFTDQYFTDKLTIQINPWQFAHIGFDFSAEKVKELNWFMENMFEEHLFLYVDAHMTEHTERKKLIDAFASQYGIVTEVDITLEALVKTEYRMRKKVARNMSAQNLRPLTLFG